MMDLIPKVRVFLIISDIRLRHFVVNKGSKREHIMVKLCIRIP